VAVKQKQWFRKYIFRIRAIMSFGGVPRFIQVNINTGP
jgi:hypothetical protein